MVDIAERIWPAWQEERDKAGDEWALHLLLSTATGRRAAVRAVRESVNEVWDRYDAEVRDRYEAAADSFADPDPPFAGEWGWVGVPGGVLVLVSECTEFDVVLPAIARALEERGVKGAIDLVEMPELPLPPWKGDLLECRVRVCGRRLHRRPFGYAWQADPAAYEAFLAAVERWCRWRDDATCWLSGRVGGVPVAAGEELLDRLLDAIVDENRTTVAATAGDDFRRFTTSGSLGEVTLAVGGETIARGGWRAPLAELAALLRDQADVLVYGWVRRGWMVSGTDGLAPDWPKRPVERPRGSHFTPAAFDDVFAPDAFGVQLLGSGYADRLAFGPMWRAERVGATSVLVEHVDPGAWFAAPFAPFGSRDVPVPPVLAQARQDLAPILYEPGALTRAGYVDDEEPPHPTWPPL